jgi:hypothetical protein
MVAVLAVKVLVGEIVAEIAGGSVGTGVVHPIRTKIKLKLITNFNFFVWFSFSSLQVIHHILIYQVGYDPLPTIYTIQENNIENKPN